MLPVLVGLRCGGAALHPRTGRPPRCAGFTASLPFVDRAAAAARIRPPPLVVPEDRRARLSEMISHPVPSDNRHYGRNEGDCRCRSNPSGRPELDRRPLLATFPA
jgi:hypothetical protein